MDSGELGEKIRVGRTTENIIFTSSKFCVIDVIEKYFRKYVGRSTWTFFIVTTDQFLPLVAGGAPDGAKIVFRVTAASVFGRLINSQFSQSNQFAGVRSDLGFA